MAEPQEQTNKSAHAEREERVLEMWKKNGVFKKSVLKDAPKGEYTFYDGPPFATGTPHYGHLLAGTIKDVIPRFKTMQGYRVRRRWGWDCHGLPIENIIEKDLGLKSKKDILNYGVGGFNEAARRNVLRYADEWRKIVPRVGRWVDMEDDYRSMDASYTESVWWVFKQLYGKGLIYEGFKSMNLCPRCETTLSNFEVAQGYKDITDISVYVKFKLSGHKGAHLLAWTTTPWTLPGNVALAVNPKIEYVKIEDAGTHYILSKERYEHFKDEWINKKLFNAPKVISTLVGSDLAGLSYEPMFDYYSKDSKLKNKENGWRIYGADFVTTEDGTGIVHIAPAFGVDDYDLLVKNHLPFVQHVGADGKFKPEAADFAGMDVKPIDTEEDKNAHQKADIEIVKWLAHRGFLFEKEKLVHSYPHCWRCNTPLLNYAASSWFVKVTDLKDKLIKENNKIKWVPPEVGSARFGNWLLGARDWAISRSRFWGAPIPVWREEGADRVHVLGSVEDLKKFSKANNEYHVMRHGEADNNVLGILSGIPDAPHHLTDVGKKQVSEAAEKLKKIKFDMIFVSPFVRTKETADIVADKIGLSKDNIIVDERLHELKTGVWNGRKVSDFWTEMPEAERFDHAPEGGETYMDVKKRTGEFLYGLENKFAGKKILIITHEAVGALLFAASKGWNKKQAMAVRKEKEFSLNAEVMKLDFTPLPHNADYELDFHRPYIDEIALTTPEGKRLTRAADVFDCWFESGSMPYGEHHYPFENTDEFDPHPGLLRKAKGFPADFIAEGLDQTRGWFYSMLVLGVALFGKSPYKKVIVNGLVLAEDGEKMSKSKKNFPDPMIIVDKYGADSLRFYLMSSPVVRGQDLCFSEKGVDEVTKKVINRLLNVVSFYEMYAEKEARSTENGGGNILDLWILSRLNETIGLVTSGLEAGELDKATRPFVDLIDDLSTWYLRRSRERFKGDLMEDKEAALRTTKFVLLEIAKAMAPVTPFLAEDIYSRVGGKEKSVHLDVWPKGGEVDAVLLEKMGKARKAASLGLEARMAAKVNVRQPLGELRIRNSELGSGHDLDYNLIELIKDEVNVKNVIFGAEIAGEVELDLAITPELKEEGMVRELMRAIQDERKEKGLTVSDSASLVIETDPNSDIRKIIEKNKETISRVAMLDKIEFEGGAENEIKINDVSLKIGLR